jgi:hypothetical protein
VVVWLLPEGLDNPLSYPKSIITICDIFVDSSQHWEPFNLADLDAFVTNYVLLSVGRWGTNFVISGICN